MDKNLVKEVARHIACNLGWEWDNPFLNAGTDEIPSRREFLATAREVIKIVEGHQEKQRWDLPSKDSINASND